jgi:hypothetical protein
MLGLVTIALVVVSVALGVLVGFLAARLRGRQQGSAAVASLDQLAATFATLEADLAAQREQTERARAERDTEARKAREYFARIDGIVKEADECRRLLVRTGAEHGNAQSMMLREIESLSIQYRTLARHYRDATKKAPPRPEPLLNSAIQFVASEFREAHVTPYQNPPVPTPAEANPLSGG